MDILFIHDLQTTSDASQAAGSVSELLRELQNTLGQLKRALHDALLGSRSSSKEARQWLINSIAGLDIQDAATKRRRFTQFLPGGAACRGAEHKALGHAMLQLLFEAAPAEVGALVAQDASLLQKFFKSEPKRVPLWFAHFSMEGMRGFRYGAAALGEYALARRDEVWHLLRWQGRHSQAPVAVAQRPHYFCELDVPRTVRHLLRDCPAFWSSREMRRSVEAGAAQLLGLDPAFWSKELLRWLEDRGSPQGDALYAALCRYLEASPWGQPCQRLLQVLPQQDLLPFADGLLGGGSAPVSRQRAGGAAQPTSGSAQAASLLVFRGVRWQSLDSLMLAAALGCRLPLLLRLLRDEEMADERQQVDSLVRQLLQLDQPPERQAAAVAAHWQLRQQLRQQGSTAHLHEMLLLHLFAAAYLVATCSSSDRHSAEQLQALLTASGLECRLVVQPALHANGSRRGKHGGSGSKKRKKRRHSSSKSKKSKNKRRRHSRSSSGSEGGDSSSDDDDADGGYGAGTLQDLGGELGELDTAEQQQQQWMWHVRLLSRERDGEASGRRATPTAISSLELLEVVIEETSAAYAAWLFGSHCS